VKFIWNETKNTTNKRKHGISFQEAKALFTSGVDYLEIFDEDHSVDEDRFLAIGPVVRGVILVVWTERDEDTIRLIGARLATRPEHEQYREYMEQRQ
jgi:uncharacterized DUF497 family protein